MPSRSITETEANAAGSSRAAIASAALSTSARLRVKQSKSCDACRARKCKCDGSPNNANIADCGPCTRTGTRCTYDFQQRKRGRQRRRELPDSDHASSSATHRRRIPQPLRMTGTSYSFEQLHKVTADSVAPLDPMSNVTPLAAASHTTDSTSFADIFPSSRRSAPPSLDLTNWAQPPNSLDAVLPRALLLELIDLYFTFIYCLIPVVHQPTFLQDIHDHREEREGEEEWTALVLAVAGTTIRMVPRQWVGLSSQQVLDCLRHCDVKVRAFLNELRHGVTVNRLVVLYLFMTSSLGYGSTSKAQQAALYGMSVAMGLHLETNYQNLNPIEMELRRRIFWLQYGSDKGGAAVNDNPVNWHEEDCSDVSLPKDVDDEYITATEYLEQPAGHTSKISGLIYISRLFRYIGQVLQRRKLDKSHPPSGFAIQSRIGDVQMLYTQVTSLMDGCPTALALSTPDLETGLHGLLSPINSPFSRLLEYLESQSTRTPHNPLFFFRVQQANIYITQQMARSVILAYLESLFALRAQEMASTVPFLSPLNPLDTCLLPSQFMNIEAEFDKINDDTLSCLEIVPVQALAICGLALTLKVRHIACRLILPASDEDVADGAPGHQLTRRTARQEKAQKDLLSYLRILTEIDSLAKLDVDEGSDFQ